MPFRELPGAERCYFQPDERLIHAGDPLDAVYYLVSGVVYRVVLTENGDESILSRKIGSEGVSSLIGILTAFSTPPYRSIHDFIAHTDCVCYKIPIDVCLAYLQQQPDLLVDLLRESVNDYTHLSKKYWAKKEKNAPAELCAFLLENSREVEGRRLLSKQYTNIEIAKFLSVHRVTVTNMLRALKEEGCVERTPQGLVLTNLSALEAYRDRQKTLTY